MRRRALVATFISAAAVLAYVVFATERFPLGRNWTNPIARVGLSLQDERVVVDRVAAPDRRDVEAVRAAWKPGEQGIFDLVVSLRGLGSGGRTDWEKADQLCRGLGWPRCDRSALEEMKHWSRPSDADGKAPESAMAFAIANATWAFGSEEAVRKMTRTELDRIPEADGPGRARVFVRFGVIDTNPDGQAALFAQACVADPSLCDRDRLQQVARREVQARFVAPGNVVPLYFGGHPRVGGIAGPR